MLPEKTGAISGAGRVQAVDAPAPITYRARAAERSAPRRLSERSEYAIRS